MTTVAFCGLGQMGAPMAARLLGGAATELRVWNRTPERALPLVEQGAVQAGSPAEAAAGADVVFTMLARPEAVEAVLFGDGGAVAALANGATVIEMSTIGPSAIRQLAARLPSGTSLLDAPVLGSIPQATDGTLKVFVGGDEAVFERHRPLLERLGTPRYLGEQGTGAGMKLVTNLCLGVLMTGLGEALALADALKLDQAAVLDILGESPIGVTAKSKRSRIESGEWPPNFKLSLAVKDMSLVADEAAAVGTELRVASTAREWLEAAEQGGAGDLDYSAVIAEIRSRG